jgi:hypothetical protein
VRKCREGWEKERDRKRVAVPVANNTIVGWEESGEVWLKHFSTVLLHWRVDGSLEVRPYRSFTSRKRLSRFGGVGFWNEKGETFTCWGDYRKKSRHLALLGHGRTFVIKPDGEAGEGCSSVAAWAWKRMSWNLSNKRRKLVPRGVVDTWLAVALLREEPLLMAKRITSVPSRRMAWGRRAWCPKGPREYWIRHLPLEAYRLPLPEGVPKYVAQGYYVHDRDSSRMLGRNAALEKASPLQATLWMHWYPELFPPVPAG